MKTNADKLKPRGLKTDLAKGVMKSYGGAHFVIMGVSIALYSTDFMNIEENVDHRIGLFDWEITRFSQQNFNF